MFLLDELRSRNDAGNPVKVGLIGAGKFGSMFLAQASTTAGLTVSVIADLDPVKAKKSCADVGWSDELISRTEYVDDAMVMMTSGKVDVLVEATGNPKIGVVHARAAIHNGIHIVMVNVEADVLAGAQLAQEAAAAGVHGASGRCCATIAYRTGGLAGTHRLCCCLSKSCAGDTAHMLSC